MRLMRQAASARVLQGAAVDEEAHTPDETRVSGGADDGRDDVVTGRFAEGRDLHEVWGNRPFHRRRHTTEL
jgi:hypothetical protein